MYADYKMFAIQYFSAKIYFFYIGKKWTPYLYLMQNKFHLEKW